MDEMIRIPENIVSVTTAARMIGASVAWVRRECRLRGVGQFVEGRYLIFPRDIEKLRGLKRPPGRPSEKFKKS